MARSSDPIGDAAAAFGFGTFVVVEPDEQLLELRELAQGALLSPAKRGHASRRVSLAPRALFDVATANDIDLELQREAEERSDQDDHCEYADAAKCR